MSDLDARRLVRELFRIGLDAEQILDVVIDEFMKNGGLNVQIETDTRKGTTIRFMPGRPIRASEPAAVEPNSGLDHAIEVNGEELGI